MAQKRLLAWKDTVLDSIIEMSYEHCLNCVNALQIRQWLVFARGWWRKNSGKSAPLDCASEKCLIIRKHYSLTSSSKNHNKPRGKSGLSLRWSNWKTNGIGGKAWCFVSLYFCILEISTRELISIWFRFFLVLPCQNCNKNNAFFQD